MMMEQVGLFTPVSESLEFREPPAAQLACQRQSRQSPIKGSPHRLGFPAAFSPCFCFLAA